MKRVVITGMGVVSPIGNDVDTLWNSIKEGNVVLMKLLHLILQIIKLN